MSEFDSINENVQKPETTETQSNINAGETLDRIGTAAAAETIDRRNDFVETNAVNNLDETNDGSPLKWLVPLILLLVLITLGWAFCRKAEAPTVTPNVNNSKNINVSNANNNAMPANTNAANK